MARIRIGKGGKTGTIDASELAKAEADGWAVVDAPQSGESEDPSPEDQQADGDRERQETLYDVGQGAIRGVTLGLNDVVAGVGAGAGALAGGGSLDDAKAAYREGRDAERAVDDATKKRSPRASGRAELGGALATLPLTVARGPALAARAASGAPVAVATGQQAAARLAPRLGKPALAGALAALGFGDVDDPAEVPGTAAKGAALGGLGELVGAPIAATAGRVGIRGLPGEVASQGRAALDALRPLASKGAKAIDAVADVIPPSLLPRGAEKASKALREIGEGAVDEATTAPVAAPDDDLDAILARLTGNADDAAEPAGPASTYEQMQALGDEFAPLSAEEQRALRQQALEELSQTRPAQRPQPSATTKPPAAPSAASVAPAASQGMPGRGGAATQLTPEQEAALLAELTNSPEYRRGVQQLQQMQAQTQRAPGQAFDPLSDLSRRTIRETSATPPISPVDNVSGRQQKVVAAIGQQEKWRATYDRLPVDQRPAYIDQLRRESGLTDDQVRQRLKLTKAEWRRTSFTR